MALDELLRRATRTDEMLAGPGREGDAHGHVLAVELCDAYRRGDDRLRVALRAGVAPLERVSRCVHGVLIEAASWVGDDGDREWLERGLAAAALTDGGAIDERDRLVGLQTLWRSAEKARITKEAELVWGLCRAPDRPRNA